MDIGYTWIYGHGQGEICRQFSLQICTSFIDQFVFYNKKGGYAVKVFLGGGGYRNFSQL